MNSTKEYMNQESYDWDSGQKIVNDFWIWSYVLWTCNGKKANIL